MEVYEKDNGKLKVVVAAIGGIVLVITGLVFILIKKGSDKEK